MDRLEYEKSNNFVFYRNDNIQIKTKKPKLP